MLFSGTDRPVWAAVAGRAYFFAAEGGRRYSAVRVPQYPSFWEISADICRR